MSEVQFKPLERPGDNWINWSGGKCPVDPEKTLVDVRFRDGREQASMLAGWWAGFGPTHDHWQHAGDHRDIVAYRVSADGERRYHVGNRVQDHVGFTGTVTDVEDDELEVTWDVSGCASDVKSGDVLPMKRGQDDEELQARLHAEIFFDA
jgi:hypothetical protein